MPGFWTLIDQKVTENVIGIPRIVYREIVENSTLPDGSRDALAQWLAERVSMVQPEPDEALQNCYQEIADHVSRTHAQSEFNRFLTWADGWVVAHARLCGGAVVTFERRVALKAKIPNVCVHFHIECITTYEVLRKLRVRFGLVE